MKKNQRHFNLKRTLGLDLGTNSIGWSLINYDFTNKAGQIDGLGVRIIPMDQKILSNFDAGQSHSQTADRTHYRSVRKLYQRARLRRERLHRVMNILGFLPKHYSDCIDFEKKLGQFKSNVEVKLNYRKHDNGDYEFLFMDSFKEMIAEFKQHQPDLFYAKENGKQTKIPYDWTLYYLRKKALEQPLSKEELAWLVLNFNQKRGYYQLRGEEVEKDDNKEFMALKVGRLEDSGEQVRGKTLYDVYFENGWKYDKRIVKTEDWLERTKEFIVTTKTLKNGDIKRTYKSVDSELDWIAIKSKTEQTINASGKTVGVFIYETLLKNPSQKIRGKLVKTIERKFYKNEFEQIISKQMDLQAQLFNDELLSACTEELYPRNEAHQTFLKQKDFKYLFTEDIIFYQRPLKSQKSTISDCPLEFRIRKQEDKETGELTDVKVPVKVISKSHPVFQEFRTWQWLKNLKIYNKEKIVKGKSEDVTNLLLATKEDKLSLFDFLSSKKELDQKQLIKYFIDKKLIKKTEKEHYCWNYVEDKTYPFAETKAQCVGRLKKVDGLADAESFLLEKTPVGRGKVLLSRLEQLWHIIYSVNDLNEYKRALETFATKHNIDVESFRDSFVKFPPFKSDYGSFSKKAIDRLLPLMRTGKYWNQEAIDSKTKDRIQKLIDGEYDEHIQIRVREKVENLQGIKDYNDLPLWLASYVVYDRHSELGEGQRWEVPGDIDTYLKSFKQHSLRNPIVEQVVMETLRVVRDIWIQYGNGAKGFFDEIHVELGREMKNPAEKRKKLSERNAENERTNHRIREILSELMNDDSVRGTVSSYSPSQQEILRIYEEGVYQNSDANYSQVSEDEIEKIRKNRKPSLKDIQRYRLWLEQGYTSPYTGEIIMLSDLFTNKYQIEHIIPQSRYFDNSLTNKVICESAINPHPYKGNLTAYEFIKNRGGEHVPELSSHRKVNLFTLDQYEAHVNRYFRKNRQKLKNLLSEEIPENFINRQLNDSRHISKLIKGFLSNIVREEGEQEATSKHLIPVTGTITSRLKHNWGLNNKWNELILPRFERLNEMTNSEEFTYINSEGKTVATVPKDLQQGFNKKRIDHRHHALDALVVACVTRDHTHYLNNLNSKELNHDGVKEKLLIRNKQGDFTKTFLMPWEHFTKEAKHHLETIVVSFKQNLRVINKTSNKFWSYKDENGNVNLDKNGKPIKKLRKQTQGDNWAIRKSMHKETVYGLYNIKTPKGKIATAVRTPLSDIKNEKQLDKITDEHIRSVILPNHLKNYLDEEGNPKFDEAFSSEGVEDLNKNIVNLNNGKKHQPIYKVKLFEVGRKFSMSEDEHSPKHKKYVEAAKGTNLFFAVYWDEKKQKRTYETVPLNEVIAHQKQVAHLPKAERKPIQPNPKKGEFLFALSPNDLVYVPSDEELDVVDQIDFENLTKEQVGRIYKMVSSTGSNCFFIQSRVSTPIKSKFEFLSLNKMEKSTEGIMIKARCIKLKTNRLGAILSIEK
ncbi:MAG: type II CRISPR RNA-guided endonuclease Cas9 [Flavobacteriales bacterium]